MVHAPSASLASTRRLLVLARDLLQAQDLKSVLELIGPAVEELLAADEALLSARLGDQEFVTAFDRRGFLQPAEHEGMLCRQARQSMHDQAPIVLPEVPAASGPPTSLLALPFPPYQAVGVLATLWHRRYRPHDLARQLAVARSIGELTGAALANVHFRLTLEAQVSACTDEVEQVAREHARELRRRDEREEEMRRLSVTDMLTGMLNRRGFFLHAEHAFKLARRQDAPSTLMFADIDGLKAVNDGLGHDKGDRLIQDSAWIMRNSFRDSDIVARFGGDEFAAFTLDSAEPAAILSRIHENVESFHRHSPRPYRISFSIGIVHCDPASDLSLSDYLAMADKEMYVQKKRRSE